MELSPTSAKLAQKLNNPILNQNHIYMRNLFPFFRTQKTTTTDRPTDRPTAIAGMVRFFDLSIGARMCHMFQLCK